MFIRFVCKNVSNKKQIFVKVHTQEKKFPLYFAELSKMFYNVSSEQAIIMFPLGKLNVSFQGSLSSGSLP